MRISEQILKITEKTGEIDSKSLDILGLNGGCGVIICPDNITIKENGYELGNTSYYDFEDEKVYVSKACRLGEMNANPAAILAAAGGNMV